MNNVATCQGRRNVTRVAHALRWDHTRAYLCKCTCKMKVYTGKWVTLRSSIWVIEHTMSVWAVIKM